MIDEPLLLRSMDRDSGVIHYLVHGTIPTKISGWLRYVRSDSPCATY